MSGAERISGSSLNWGLQMGARHSGHAHSNACDDVDCSIRRARHFRGSGVDRGGWGSSRGDRQLRTARRSVDGFGFGERTPAGGGRPGENCGATADRCGHLHRGLRRASARSSSRRNSITKRAAFHRPLRLALRRSEPEYRSHRVARVQRRLGRCGGPVPTALSGPAGDGRRNCGTDRRRRQRLVDIGQGTSRSRHRCHRWSFCGDSG